MKKYLWVGVTLALTIVLAGCGGSKNQSASTASNEGTGSSKKYPEFHIGTLVWGGGVSLKNNGWIQTSLMESLVTQGLLEIGPNGQPTPGLASSVEHPSPTTYIYNIRKGVRFSDGKPLTITDVVYSLNLNKDRLFTVSGPWTSDVASVSPQGSSAVVVKLKRPNPDWPNIMVQASAIFEKASVEKVSEVQLGKPGGLPVGTGPWKFDSYTPESSVQFSRNPYWSGPSQPTEKISVTEFKNEATMALALQSGAIDAAVGYGSQKAFLHVAGTREVSGGQQDVVGWMSMHASSPPFNDVHVRRAIAYAVEREAMIKALFPSGGVSITPVVVPTALFASMGSSSQASEMIASLPKYEFNLAKAKQELARSAYPHGFTTVARYYVGEPILGDAAQIVVQDLAKIGITVELKPQQGDETSLEEEKKNAPLLLNEYLSFTPNGASTLMSLLLSPENIWPHGSGVNWALYSNAEVGKLIQELSSTSNEAQRRELAEKALRIVVEEEPYLPLWMHGVFMQLSNKFVDPGFSFYRAAYSPWMMSMKLAQ